MSRIALAVFVLVALNVVTFFVGAFSDFNVRFITHAALWFTGNPHFRVWQFLTHMFLHASVGHILFNMLALASFGSALERKWGAKRFLIFYLICGLGAGLTQTAVNSTLFHIYFNRALAAGISSSTIQAVLSTGRINLNPNSPLFELYRIYAGPMIGASGAIYGIMVAFGFMYPNARLSFMFLPVPMAVKYFIPIILALDLFSGVTGYSIFGQNVGHFAHLGGAALGFILMLVWRKRDIRPIEEPKAS